MTGQGRAFLSEPERKWESNDVEKKVYREGGFSRRPDTRTDRSFKESRSGRGRYSTTVVFQKSVVLGRCRRDWTT